MSGHDLPPLATVEELAAWVDAEIPAGDPQATAILQAASALVRSHTGRTWVDPGTGDLEQVPAAVHTVVLQVAGRIWRNPSGYIQDTTGPFTVRWSERVAEGLYLTAAEEAMLAPLAAGRSPLRTLSTTRGPLETGSVRVPRSGVPLLARDDL
jgi:hypothetical protein